MRPTATCWGTTRTGNLSNAPQTYLLDGRQHLLVAVRTRLFDFVIY
jgi:hypothetical protein